MTLSKVCEKKKKIFFIFNPNSGKKEIKNKLIDILYVFKSAGYAVTVYPTSHSDEIQGVIKENCSNGEYDIVVTAGGDGTLNETIEGIMLSNSGVKLGYIPTGTVNDFASGHKIPKNPVKAAQKIVDGEPFLCDVGKFDNKYFSYIAAFGAFTEASYQTPQQNKNLLGKAAYFLEGLKLLPALREFYIEIESEECSIKDRFIFGMISNSIYVGGFKVSKNILYDDGYNEVLLIKTPKNIIEIQDIINSIMKRDFSSEYIVSFKTKKISFHSDEKITWTLDGEYGGKKSDVVVKNIEKSLNIIV